MSLVCRLTAIRARAETEPTHAVGSELRGASEALLILFFRAAEPGANVVLPNPGFPANTALAKSLGLAIRYYSLRAENRFRVDLDEVRKLVDADTRMLLVNSPHNPTGSVLSDEDMQSL